MFADDETFDPRDSSIPTLSELEWQPILHASNQVVLYNPTSHALSVQRSSSPESVAGLVRRRDIHRGERCPYCHKLIGHEGSSEDEGEESEEEYEEDTGLNLEDDDGMRELLAV